VPEAKRLQTPLFTDAYLKSLRPEATGYTRTEPGERGAGRLVVEVAPDGAKHLYFRYRLGGVDKLKKIGRYDASGTDGVTLKKARARRREFSDLLQEHGDVKDYLAAEDRKRDQLKRRGTLGDLCTAYVANLKTAGKLSARQVERALSLHVEKAHRKLWTTPAADMTPANVRDVLAKMVKAGRTRQVNLVRAYLGAAFAWGAKADNDPRSTAAEGKHYGLQSNPVTLVPRIGEWDRAGERALSDDELAAYWCESDTLPAPQRDCLRFLLALGGQRASQVLRAPWSAYDFEASILHLHDPKGRGGVRDHLLPLTDLALAQLTLMRSANAKAPGPFSSDGETVVRLETLSKAVTGISARLTKQHEYAAFRFGDLRRTCETTLARLGVSKEVRAWLLSHGRSSDVQTRHYDRNTYLPEKKAALEAWAAHLLAIQKPQDQRGATVHPISGRKARNRTGR
jgi:integrase